MNFWTTYFRDLYQGALDLEQYKPFSSKDCDIWVDYDAFKYFESEPGQLRKSDSPADGQVAIYTLPGKDSLTVDLMTSVHGIPMHELDRALKRVQVVNQSKRGLKHRSVFLARPVHSSHIFADYDCYARISYEGRWPGAAPLHR